MLLRATFLMLANFCQTLSKMQESIVGAFVSFLGVLMGLFAGHIIVIHALIFCLLFDFVVAIWVDVKFKQFCLTKVVERLITKIVAYFGSITLVLYIESSINFLDGTFFNGGILSGLICATELWSILGGMLAINPNIPGLKLLRRLLKSEIARKVGIEESELEKTINEELFQQTPSNKTQNI